MKVTDRQPLPVPSPVASDKGEQGAEAARKQHPAKAAPREDRVVLSANERVDRVNASLDTVPDVRLDKVNDIRARIDAGTYQVSGADVAAKIIDTLRQGRQK